MTRSILRIAGDDRAHFLQGLLTQDVTALESARIQFAALLSPQGKILHDMFLLHQPDAILLDTDAEFAPTLLKRLIMYKLRAKVTIERSDDAATGTYPDPRHPQLPRRTYPPGAKPNHDPALTLGIPLLGRDFAPDSLTALDAGYDLLHAVSFTKGCYVGQEITARMHYKSIARRGWFLLERDDRPPRLANLKFDEVIDPNTAISHTPPTATVTVDNLSWRATLPAWMLPKYTQFETAAKNQP